MSVSEIAPQTPMASHSHSMNREKRAMECHAKARCMAGVKFYGQAKKASARVSCLTGCVALLKRRQKRMKARRRAKGKERSRRLKGAPPFHACLPRACLDLYILRVKGHKAPGGTLVVG